MFKNVATKIAVFAFTPADGLPKTGDAAQLTAYVSKDYGAVTALTDTSATEMDATNAPGWYWFDVAQAETNADFLLFTGKSSTSGVKVVGQPIHTTPNRFTSLVIDAAGLVDANTVKVGPTGSGTAQTAKDIGGAVPAAVAGAAGGLFIAGTNAATTANITGTITTVTSLTNDAAKYMHGAVWISAAGSAGSTQYSNGIMTNPVDNLADAKSIADNLKLKKFYIQTATTLTLAATYSGYQFVGEGWTLALGNQAIAATYIEGATVTGIGTGAASVFERCHIGTVTLPTTTVSACGLSGTFTVSATGIYTFDQCFTEVAAGGDWVLDFAAVGATTLGLRHFAGSMEVRNMAAGDVLVVAGTGRITVNANCTAGEIHIRGNFELLNSGAATVTDSARFELPNVAKGVWRDTVAADFTTASSIGKALYTGNFVPGAAGGLLIAGSNAATTFAGLTTGALATGTITTTGNFAISGTLGVAGVTTFAAINTGTIATTGNWTVSGDFVITGGFRAYGSCVLSNGTLSIGDLFVVGNTTLSANVAFGATSLQSLIVTTGTTLTGAVSATNASNDIRGITVGALGANVITAASMNADASTEIATTLLATAVDGTTTVAESIRLHNSALGGKATGLNTTTATYRDLADTKDRIVATVDADGNRSPAPTLTLT